MTNEETAEPTKRGRGRPKGKICKLFAFRLHNDVEAYVRSQPNMNGFINECIREHQRREEAGTL